MNAILIASFAIASYLISGLMIGVRLFSRAAVKQLPRMLGIGVGLAGLLAHAVFLYHNVVSEQGINLGFFDAGSCVAWTVLLLVLLSALSKPVENLGVVILPIAALTIVMQIRYPTVHFLPADAPLGLQIHVLISLLAYSLLAMASVQAILLAVQDHQLHNRRPGGFVRALPPLQTMEVLLFEMIGLGFALLTLALFSGFLFLEDMFAQRLAHKTILSIAAWLVFGTLLWGRFRSGWRGQKALIWTLAGFVVLMLAYFGSKFVIELVLQRG